MLNPNVFLYLACCCNVNCTENQKKKKKKRNEIISFYQYTYEEVNKKKTAQKGMKVLAETLSFSTSFYYSVF